MDIPLFVLFFISMVFIFITFMELRRIHKKIDTLILNTTESEESEESDEEIEENEENEENEEIEEIESSQKEAPQKNYETKSELKV